MKDTHPVRRRLVPRLDAARRWRQLYQRLLELGVSPALGEPSVITHLLLPDTEVAHECCSVCSVSTQRQAEEKTITQQIDRLHAKARAEGWTIAPDQSLR